VAESGDQEREQAIVPVLDWTIVGPLAWSRAAIAANGGATTFEVLPGLNSRKMRPWSGRLELPARFHGPDYPSFRSLRCRSRNGR